MAFGRVPDRQSRRDLLLVCVAAFGLAASLTFVWLGMSSGWSPDNGR